MAITTNEMISIITKKLPMSMIFWGHPGIGKSDAVREAGKKMGYNVQDIRLSQIDPTEIRGLPVVHNGHATWCPPSFLSFKEKTILFLDELNHATNATLAAAYQLILDRRCGELRLPADTIVCAASNQKGAGMFGYELPLPLKNRFIHYTVECNHREWIDWAITSNIRNEVVSFIAANPKDLISIPSKEVKDFYAYPTPRTWTFVSHVLNAFEDIEDLGTQNSIYGSVGKEHGARFSAFTKLTKKVPPPEEILANPQLIKEVNKQKDAALIFFCLQNVVEVVGRKQEDISAFENVVLLADAPKELIAFVIRSARDIKGKRHIITRKIVDYLKTAKEFGIAQDMERSVL